MSVTPATGHKMIPLAEPMRNKKGNYIKTTRGINHLLSHCEAVYFSTSASQSTTALANGLCHLYSATLCVRRSSHICLTEGKKKV